MDLRADAGRPERTPFWLAAAGRSAVWLGGAGCLAWLRKPDGAGLLALRTDAAGWLGAAIVLAALAGHAWSNVHLARGERRASDEPGALVADGPFRYVRNPIYLAGVAMLTGVGLLYPDWSAADLAAPAVVLVFFHVRVVRSEEPALRRRFGATYEAYCRRVPRWLPARS